MRASDLEPLPEDVAAMYDKRAVATAAASS
jgi:hypothetical protein